MLCISSIAPAGVSTSDAPASCKIEGVARTKQLTNYCGPACLTSVLRHYGSQLTQEDIGKETYDPSLNATNGADMLYFARERGFSAYSWNSSLSDVKRKIAAGVPVIVLQQNSLSDKSGHYRVLTGYNDAKSKFSVMDPYYDDITEMSYAQCERLWGTMGHWALAVIPASKDTFHDELDAKNPVVHMDMSLALYKHKDYDKATKEANTALSLEPGNQYALSMLGKIQGASGKK